MSSNLLVEAMLPGKNVLSILPMDEEKNWMSELKADTIPIVFTREDLKDKLIDLSCTSGLLKEPFVSIKKQSLEDIFKII